MAQFSKQRVQRRHTDAPSAKASTASSARHFGQGVPEGLSGIGMARSMMT